MKRVYRAAKVMQALDWLLGVHDVRDNCCFCIIRYRVSHAKGTPKKKRLTNTNLKSAPGGTLSSPYILTRGPGARGMPLPHFSLQELSLRPDKEHDNY